MDTAFFRERVPNCMVNLIDKYGIDIRLDDFGMGKEMFIGKRLLGYWFESNIGIEFYPARESGSIQLKTFGTWKALCDWLDTHIKMGYP